jgi:RNA polymerase sigma-70 factor (ECF subfamily)
MLKLLKRLGRTDEARDTYRRARELTDDDRRFLERRLTELAAATGSG